MCAKTICSFEDNLLLPVNSERRFGFPQRSGHFWTWWLCDHCGNSYLLVSKRDGFYEVNIRSVVWDLHWTLISIQLCVCVFTDIRVESLVTTDSLIVIILRIHRTALSIAESENLVSLVRKEAMLPRLCSEHAFSFDGNSGFWNEKCLTHGCKNTRVLDSTWEICALGLLNYQTSTVCKTQPRGPQSVKSPPPNTVATAQMLRKMFLYSLF